MLCNCKKNSQNKKEEQNVPLASLGQLQSLSKKLCWEWEVMGEIFKK